MSEFETEKEQQQYVSLKYFGIPKLGPYVKPLKGTIICMAVLCLVAGLIDTLHPLFQQYALNHFVELSTLDFLPYTILNKGG